MERRIRKYKKILDRPGGLDKLPVVARDGIRAWVRWDRAGRRKQRRRKRR